MENFKYLAKMYRDMIENCKKNNNEDFTEGLDERVRVYETLEGLKEGDQFIIFDSGIYNNVLLGYMNIVLSEIGHPELKDDARDALRYIIDTVSSEQAEKY